MATFLVAMATTLVAAIVLVIGSGTIGEVVPVPCLFGVVLYLC